VDPFREGFQSFAHDTKALHPVDAYQRKVLENSYICDAIEVRVIMMTT